MTGFLNTYILMLMLFIFIVMMLTNLHQKPRRKRNKSKRKPTAKSRNDEVLDTLEWLMQNQIITQSEYTKLIGKCLPFFEG